MNEYNLTESRFYDLCDKYKSDKSSQHGYHKILPFYLKDHCNKAGGMLELSLPGCVQKHKQMWLEMFPNMHVYMLDKASKTSLEERATVINCDQGNADDLQKVASYIKGQDIPMYFISDDGCHSPVHQVLAFNTFFPLLEVGGVYIIEDIEVSYWKNGNHHGVSSRYGQGCSGSVIEIFKRAIDGINYEFSQTRDQVKGLCDRIVQHQQEIHSVSFARNCIIIIKKEFEEDRDYRFAHKLQEQVAGEKYYDYGTLKYD